MKNIIFLIFIISPISICAQENLKGIYLVKDLSGNFAEFIDFKNNNEFYYETSGHLGIESYGCGTYKFNSKNLILDFKNTEPLELSNHKSKFWINNKQEIELNVFVTDLNGNEIPYANIYSENTKEGVVANEKGFGLLTLNKKDENSKLIISFIGYLREEIEYRQDFNYEFRVFLKKGGMPTPILNEIDTLKITKKKRAFFKTMDKNKIEKLWEKDLQEY